MANYKEKRELEARFRAAGGHDCDNGCMDCESSAFRVRCIPDESASLDDLKGDCFSSEVNPEIDLETLKAQEADFEREVASFGVWGLVLEAKENGQWVHTDSCWGFCDQGGLDEYYGELVARAEAIVESRKVMARAHELIREARREARARAKARREATAQAEAKVRWEALALLKAIRACETMPHDGGRTRVLVPIVTLETICAFLEREVK